MTTIWNCTQPGEMGNDAAEGSRGPIMQIYRPPRPWPSLLQAVGVFEGHGDTNQETGVLRPGSFTLEDKSGVRDEDLPGRPQPWRVENGE